MRQSSFNHHMKRKANMIYRYTDAHRAKRNALLAARNAVFYFRQSGHIQWLDAARANVRLARTYNRIMVARVHEWAVRS
jgi:hypothetical protein